MTSLITTVRLLRLSWPRLEVVRRSSCRRWIISLIIVSSFSATQSSPVTLSPCRSWPAAITFPVFRVSVKTHQRKCLCKHNIMLWERWSRLKATQRKDNRGESVESVPPAPSGSGRRPACPGVCRCADMLVCRRCICICTFVFIALCDQVCESDRSPAAACWARWTVWCPVCFCSVWPVPFTSACWPQLTGIASFFYKTRRLFSWLIICRLFTESIDKSFSVSQSPTRRRLLIQQTKNQILVTIIGLPNNQWFIFLWLIHLLIVAALL